MAFLCQRRPQFIKFQMFTLRSLHVLGKQCSLLRHDNRANSFVYIHFISGQQQMSNSVYRNKISCFCVVTFLIFMTTIWSASSLKRCTHLIFRSKTSRQRMESKVHKHDTCDKEITSVHSDQIHEVHNVPVDVLIRPIPSVLDEAKVQSLMDTIKVRQLYRK